jgi:hypothetical protein
LSPEGGVVAKTVHQLKVTLRQVKPPVWRRIVVESDATLGELAAVLEAAMGWLGGHLHSFDVGGTRYGMPNPDWGMDDLDENRFRLDAVLPKVGVKMRWDYDFGDGWEHDVLVEAISIPERGVEHPLCLAGRRACPPEDCGGPWGYADLLEALANPDHAEHEDLREWAPRDFDPAFFDIEETTDDMRSPRPLEGWV